MTPTNYKRRDRGQAKVFLSNKNIQRVSTILLDVHLIDRPHCFIILILILFICCLSTETQKFGPVTSSSAYSPAFPSSRLTVRWFKVFLRGGFGPSVLCFSLHHLLSPVGGSLARTVYSGGLRGRRAVFNLVSLALLMIGSRGFRALWFVPCVC